MKKLKNIFMRKIKASQLQVYIILLLLSTSLCQCGGVFKKGLNRYQAAEYNAAIPLFKEALKNNKVSKAKGNKYIAESFRRSGNLKDATSYYKAAVDAGSSDPRIKFYLAQGLKASGDYNQALKYYEEYAKMGGDEQLKKLAKIEVENKEKYKELLDTESLYEVDYCKGINTEAAEFGPVIHDGKVIFSSSRKKDIYQGNGTGFLGMYQYDLKTLKANQEGSADVFEYTLMREKAHDASATFAHNGKFIIFARSGTGEKMKKDELQNEVDLYLTNLTESGWSIPKKMKISNLKYWDGCPSIHPSGKKLYFASNRKGGYGGLDLYVARLTPSGNAYAVKNLGPEINTPGNEMFPVVSNEGVLYFSSDGHTGFGQLDLFEAIRKNGKITVENLGQNINSLADDFGMCFETDSTGFFTSNRDGGKGDDDIYSFFKKKPKETPKTVNYNLVVEVSGIDSTQKRYLLDDARVQVYEGTKQKRGKLLHDFLTDKSGRTKTFPIKTPPQDFFIEASKLTYLTEFVDYTTAGKEMPYEILSKEVTDTTLLVKLGIPELFQEEEFNLGINFDFNQFKIRQDAALKLDSVAEVLKENLELEIELGSHTDAVGNANSNHLLSEKRAKSTAEYLISKGVPRTMIVRVVGYGESKLKIQTHKAEERNRRTEIKIVGFKKRKREPEKKE